MNINWRFLKISMTGRPVRGASTLNHVSHCASDFYPFIRFFEEAAPRREIGPNTAMWPDATMSLMGGQRP